MNLTRIDAKPNKIQGLMTLLNLPKAYKYQVQSFIRFCQSRSLAIDPTSFRKAADHRYLQVQEREISAATFNLFICANRQFVLRMLEIRKASAVQIYAADKLMRTKAIKKTQGIEACQVLSPEEIAILKENATPRGRLLIEFLQITALRISEALNVTTKLIHKGTHLQTQILGKGGKMRNVFIPNQLYDEIIRTYNGKKFLFETKNGNKLNRVDCYKLIKAAARKAIACGDANTTLLAKAKPHALRHAFATHALSMNRDLQWVSECLGHSSVSTTAKFYIKRQIKAEDVFSVYSSPSKDQSDLRSVA